MMSGTITKDKFDTPEAKAHRVKYLRNLANLTRKQLCEASPINLNTLIGWEVGRHGGLSKIGAKRIIERVRQEGVLCTENWLLYGEGQSPSILTHYNHSQPQDASDELQNIQNELSLFCSQYSDTLQLTVTDDSMIPVFEAHDQVAGILLPEEEFKLAIDKPCIIQLEKENNLLLRILKPGSTQAHYHLCGYDINATLNHPTLYDAEITKLAPVIWHRKPSLNKEEKSS